MPNWCWNSLVITGEKEEISKFKEKFDSRIESEIISAKFEGEKLKDDYLKKFKDEGKALEDFDKYMTLQEMKFEDFLKKILNLSINESGDVIKENEKGLFSQFYPVEDMKNSYDWCIENWGTKWNPHLNDFDFEESCITFTFDSAWSPPTNWLQKVAKDYPNLFFTLEYEESGCCFKGSLEICINDNVDVKEFNGNWYGECGECDSEFTSEGICKCVDDNGKNLVWGEEKEEEEEV